MTEAPGGLQHVPVPPAPPERFREVLDDAGWARLVEMIGSAQERLQGRVVWTVSSTAHGGGVAEMLHSLIAYVRGTGIDMRWVVIPGDAEFFRITKRIHNRLHGEPGDGGPLGPEERAHYEATVTPSAEALAALVRPGDLALVHDPQPAGMVGTLRRAGATVVWRCHVGADEPNAIARATHDFLRPFVAAADALVFSRAQHVWAGLDRDRVHIIPPSIDAFSAKNQPIADDAVQRILFEAGVLPDGPSPDGPTFVRRDGSPGHVRRRARLRGLAAVDPELPIVCQVSRWDRLKDPAGVVRGFAEHVLPHHDAQLVLAGPAPSAVSDDPEGTGVLAELAELLEALGGRARERVAIAELPMDDGEENAAIVNALQRRSAVVVQKSLAEGFGLTVAEAMWKARPVVGSRVGGIQDQIGDGHTGLLVAPTDLAAFGAATVRLLADPPAARAMGAAARVRVRDHFLGARHLIQWTGVLLGLIDRPDRPPGDADG
jgi:trehalose synthase